MADENEKGINPNWNKEAKAKTRAQFVNRNKNSSPSSTLLIESEIKLGGESSSDYPRKPVDLASDMMKNFDEIREMIKYRKDPYDILDKIVTELMGNYRKCCEIIEKYDNSNFNRCKDLNDQMVSLENETMNKINYVQQHSENNIDAIKLAQKCKDEVNILWISFTDPTEIENLRIKSKSDQIHEAKRIFKRMNIKYDEPYKVIMDVIIQKVSVKTDNTYENELIMGIKFTNSIVVSYMKRQINEYGKNKFINKNYDLIRYSVRNFWSFKIWKLLRVCYDLKNFKLIENANVTEHGIDVSYKKSINQESSHEQKIRKKFIRTENDLDILRSEVNDICNDVPTFQLYDGNYFKLGFNERKVFKDNILLTSIDRSENSILDTQNSFSESITSNGKHSKLISRLHSYSKEI